MPVPMLDLKAQYGRIKDEINEAVLAVLESQQFRGGAVVEDFESAIAAYTQARYALGVSSGTDAILLALQALDLPEGAEVITTTFTFFATGGAIANAGLKPVFVDILPDTFCIDPEQVKAQINERTAAIVPVHLFGQAAEMDLLSAIAQAHDLPLIEDAAQALGATYKGTPVCTLGDVASVSFYPTKNLGAAGEGGMILTNRQDLAERVRMLRAHGMNAQYIHALIGTNSHLHALQAAVLQIKLRHLNEWNEQRRQCAAYYDAKLKELPEITRPIIADGNESVYHQYVIRVPRRDEARALFQERGIGCGVFYPLPLHQQECFKRYHTQSASCPVAEQASKDVFALPMFPELTPEQMDEVVATLKSHLATA